MYIFLVLEFLVCRFANILKITERDDEMWNILKRIKMDTSDENSCGIDGFYESEDDEFGGDVLGDQVSKVEQKLGMIDK